MDELSGYSELTEMLHNAAGSPIIWDRFLCRLAEIACCGRSFLLLTDHIQKENTHFLFHFNLSEKQQKLIINNFNTSDTFNKLLINNPCQVICSQKSPAKAGFNFNSQLNVQYHFGFSIPYNNHHTLTLCVNRNQPFSTNEQSRIRLLLLSIIMPLQTAIKTELEHKIYSQIIQYIPDHFDCYVIVNKSMQILFSDSVFPSVIGKCKCITVNNKQIQMLTPEANTRLSCLIDKNEIAQLNKPSELCQITLIPISALDNLYGWECFKNSFILAFNYNKKNNPIIKRLLDIHKLSKCEALCALDFLQTPSIVEIAENTCRSQDTIRNHLKHIMHKMNVHNQAALMKKLVSLTAL